MAETCSSPASALLALYQCLDCGMGFPNRVKATVHTQRAGHRTEHVTCATCGVHLLGFTSVRVGYCYSCRREMRATLHPEDLRAVAEALMRFGAQLRSNARPSAAYDVESEARCLREEIEDLLRQRAVSAWSQLREGHHG